MQVIVNGDAITLVDGLTVAGLFADLDQECKGVAVAVNEEVVPRSTWDHAVLASGDRVEILRAAQGG